MLKAREANHPQLLFSFIESTYNQIGQVNIHSIANQQRTNNSFEGKKAMEEILPHLELQRLVNLVKIHRSHPCALHEHEKYNIKAEMAEDNHTKSIY